MPALHRLAEVATNPVEAATSPVAGARAVVVAGRAAGVGALATAEAALRKKDPAVDGAGAAIAGAAIAAAEAPGAEAGRVEGRAAFEEAAGGLTAVQGGGAAPAHPAHRGRRSSPDRSRVAGSCPPSGVSSAIAASQQTAQEQPGIAAQRQRLARRHTALPDRRSCRRYSAGCAWARLRQSSRQIIQRPRGELAGTLWRK